MLAPPLSRSWPGQPGPGGRGSGRASLRRPRLLSSRSRLLRSRRRVGFPAPQLLGLRPVRTPPGSQAADGRCQGSAGARARRGSAAGPGSSPASAPRSAPLPRPRPPGRRRRRLPARVKEERAAQSLGCAAPGEPSRRPPPRAPGGTRRAQPAALGTRGPRAPLRPPLEPVQLAIRPR